MKPHAPSGYDPIAREYASRLYRELEHKPLDRELLDRLAAKVEGTICDIGCGPGQIARHLKDRGAQVEGIDLSAAMIAEARRLNPDIRFSQGDMRALENVADGSFAAVVAGYAIVNIPPDDLPGVFREFRRVLRPSGVLLVSFHVGHETVHVTDWYGVAVDLDFYFYPVDKVATLLREAGFEMQSVNERPPYPDVETQTNRAYVFARVAASRA